LLIGFGFGLPLLLLENVSIQAKFSRRDNILLDEEALLASTEGATADFFALISDGRVWVQAGLFDNIWD
jgi:hypothetical protein